MEFERREAARVIRESYDSIAKANRGNGLRIFFLALTVDVGKYQGDSTHVTELISNLRQMGCRVRWIARQSRSRETWPDPLFHCVSRASKPNSEIMRLVQLLLSMARGAFYIFRYARVSDLIYSRDRFSTLLALIPARIFDRPLVYEVNGLTSEQRKMQGRYLLNRAYVWLLETLDKVAFKNAVSVVCVTDAIKDFYSARYPEYSDRFTTVNNGVNTKLFRPLPIEGEIGELRKYLGFDEGDEVVAYVGNLSLWQGVEYLVRSAPIIVRENPSVRFMIVGQGPTFAACRKLADDLDVGDRFTFVGQVPYTSLAHYINVADVCVAPYTRGIPNCPIKIYEYLACGKPVVCSDIPGIENLRGSGAITLVEPCNPDALASSLLKVLADKCLRTAQRELGPKAILEYTWTNTTRKVAAICEKAMERGKVSR
ncbi:MAG: glycosyltransferase family 4 protein [Candidatus Lindowbacteria bacterium]|nr:glycosyltransferase family 4 protein [Candidatus Lindowbacteria bacterium]